MRAPDNYTERKTEMTSPSHLNAWRNRFIPSLQSDNEARESLRDYHKANARRMVACAKRWRQRGNQRAAALYLAKARKCRLLAQS